MNLLHALTFVMQRRDIILNSVYDICSILNQLATRYVKMFGIGKSTSTLKTRQICKSSVINCLFEHICTALSYGIVEKYEHNL